MVRACKLTGFAMTDAKDTLFVQADGIDKNDGSQLVRLYGEPEKWIGLVRNATGVADLRARPRWDDWYANVTIKYNGDVFVAEDIANIMRHVGEFVGIGEGRPDSPKSTGLGYGLFRIETQGDAE